MFILVAIEGDASIVASSLIFDNIYLFFQNITHFWLYSSFVVKFLSTEYSFEVCEQENSMIYRPGQYSACRSNSKLNSCNFAIVFIDLWLDELSWWNGGFFFLKWWGFCDFVLQTMQKRFIIVTVDVFVFAF